MNFASLNPQQIVDIYIAFILLSALVQSLPPLTEKSGPIYSTIYRFLNILVADFKSYAAKRLPVNPTQPEQETK